MPFFLQSSCDSSPCKNTGKCIPLYQENGYTCICVEGFTGRNCEKNIDVCKSNPCLNNGTCTDRANGFNCSCPAGFAGKRCEIDVISNVVTQFLSPAIGNNSNWALCWQASTHGWAGTTFHNKCDGKRHTITIIKKDQYVFGGYTDIPWRICPDNWIHLQGSCYQFSSKGLSWTAAKSACEAKGSKLAMVTSKAEQTLVSKVSQNVWIGLRRDPKVHSRWLWVDGSRATYTHWHPGEPNDHGGNEDCTHMFPPAGKWNDRPCSSSLQHLCETNAFLHGYGSTSKSFIFSLLDKEGFAPFKSMVTNTSFAIYRGSSYGPTFGREYDIYIADNANQNTNSYTNFGSSYSLPNNVTDRYTILAGARYFSPDEVEVFYLT
ncbi:uncharacterized protein [Porites lutea]|uniref:uncharacterized protein n=1 Tax=Porites lutea TaxID=51062 RepID=UPI003CC53B56